MIDVKGLTKRFTPRGPPAVDSIDMDIQDGEIVGLAGLNGAGKTTAMKVMVGILLPTAGTVHIDGHDIVTDKINASRGIGWVPETPVFDDDAKPVSLLKYYAGFHGIGNEEAERIALELLEKVSLTPYLNRKINHYSQGMKKRFALVASMISDPRNYLLDEILNGLDPAGVNFMREKMLEMKKDGKSVLISSHILMELEDFADRVIIVDSGKIADSVRIEDLRRYTVDRAEFIIDNLDDGAVKILENFGEVEIRGKTAVVKGLKKKASEINSELVKGGYVVSSFRSDRLENYFLNKVRRGK